MPSTTETQLPKDRRCRGRNLIMEVANGPSDDTQVQPLAVPYDFSAMKAIRQVVHQYQVQSPAHFELDLEVHQVAVGVQVQHKHSSKAIVYISLEGCTVEGRISLPVTCRVTSRGHRLESATWKCSNIGQGQGQQKLEQLLSARFPTIGGPLRQDTLWRWWLRNEKTFNWTDLPTELKERVIERCMHQPYTHGIYHKKITNFSWRYKNNRKIRKPGPYEIVDQLSDWYPLLYVSHQVRAITLRLCITGGSSIYSKGLCISSSSYRSFCERIDRLGDYYQMIEPNSVPMTSREEASSKCYRRFPHIYPSLKQYATLRHGIQNISLGMDFLSFMHFFKVETGGFQRFSQPRGFNLDYRVFERLPSLKEVVIRLPLRPRGGWRDSLHAGGPQLFHEDSPCARSLHKVIYERIAEALAPYEKVTVRNFIDDHERKRFESFRVKAVKALKLTKLELEELYADDGGGVELSAGLERATEVSKDKIKAVASPEYPDYLQDGYFPPLCHCNEPCIMASILGASEGY